MTNKIISKCIYRIYGNAYRNNKYNDIISLLSKATTILATVDKAIDAERQNHIPVIFVIVNFDECYHEINLRNKRFSAIPNCGRMTIYDKETQIR